MAPMIAGQGRACAPGWASVWLFALAVAFGASPAAAQGAPDSAGPIQDNSFLIEEAYNQEQGVVQHISTFSRPDAGGAWAYSFTQEWPLGGIRHQLSYGVPLQHADGSGTGLGDLALNYRYQLIGDPDARLLVAPRLTLLLPTGNDRQGRGAGAAGLQGNLPVSFMLAPKLATHWNAGFTLTPSSHDPLGQTARTAGFNLGASAIWLLRPSFNLMVEALWLSTESVVGAGRTEREKSVFLNPGIRWAFDFASGLQVVPGLAYTIGLGPSEGQDGVFLYLSFEHPFKRAASTP